ncbi:hypothetical protein [Isoptericola sp. b408]|uniref:hypothetical protein n=1 Tax=Isoptericola sp. b408 TaxID=3064653 RepID=UPI002713744C|nr:hypothetical protein [Isoptericola sp. b408]MDO8150198.1 hypothetical protein [Isoptericola sp. b408]
MKKEQIVAEIALAIGVDAPPMSSGSTEPRAIFDLVNDRLGLGLEGTTKQGLARGIVEIVGGTWTTAYESRGATVTKDGLLAVRDAVRTLTA